MRSNWENDHDWSFVVDVLKIALGVFIGCMAFVFAYEKLLVWRLDLATAEVMQHFEGMQKQQTLAEDMRLQQRKERERQKQREALEREWEAQKRNLAAQRKEQAWEAYFKPSAACRADPVRKECADEHIRARRAFEAQYRDD